MSIILTEKQKSMFTQLITNDIKPNFGFATVDEAINYANSLKQLGIAEGYLIKNEILICYLRPANEKALTYILNSFPDCDHLQLFINITSNELNDQVTIHYDAYITILDKDKNEIDNVKPYLFDSRSLLHNSDSLFSLQELEVIDELQSHARSICIKNNRKLDIKI